MYDLDKIYRFAFRLRTAIESVPKNRLPITFSSFPRGSCGDASLILSAYLVDNGFTEFVYVTGERGEHDAGTWSSHTWLEADGLVADITADQFRDTHQKWLWLSHRFGIKALPLSSDNLPIFVCGQASVRFICTPSMHN